MPQIMPNRIHIADGLTVFGVYFFLRASWRGEGGAHQFDWALYASVCASVRVCMCAGAHAQLSP